MPVGVAKTVCSNDCQISTLIGITVVFTNAVVPEGDGNVRQRFSKSYCH